MSTYFEDSKAIPHNRAKSASRYRTEAVYRSRCVQIAEAIAKTDSDPFVKDRLLGNFANGVHIPDEFPTVNSIEKQVVNSIG